jgi:hypothetical protein
MRRVFNLVSLLSLVLCAATVLLWVRSLNTGDRFGWSRVHGERGRRGEIASGRGRIVLSLDTAETPFISGYADEPGRGWEHGDVAWIMHERDSYGFPESGPIREWRICGFEIITFNAGCVIASVRDATVVVVTAILPLLWVTRVLLIRKVDPRHCPKCGYNLCGNTSGTCPECGKPILSCASAADPKKLAVRARRGGNDQHLPQAAGSKSRPPSV